MTTTKLKPDYPTIFRLAAELVHTYDRKSQGNIDGCCDAIDSACCRLYPDKEISYLHHNDFIQRRYCVKYKARAFLVKYFCDETIEHAYWWDGHRHKKTARIIALLLCAELVKQDPIK